MPGPKARFALCLTRADKQSQVMREIIYAEAELTFKIWQPQMVCGWVVGVM